MKAPKLNGRGELVDALIENPRRLRIMHWCLGIASAFVYWIQPGSFTPRMHTPRKGDGVIVIFETVVAWGPYVISGIFSRSVLSARAPKATFVFIVCSVGVAIGAACLYLNAFRMREAPSPLLVSTGVTLALVFIAGLCSAVWRKDDPE